MRSTAERERTVREIAKTRASILKKHRALKTGKMEDELVLERTFKSIVDPLRRIVENTGRDAGGETKPDVGARKRGFGDGDGDGDDESERDEGEAERSVARRPKPRKRSSAASIDSTPTGSRGSIGSTLMSLRGPIDSTPTLGFAKESPAVGSSPFERDVFHDASSPSTSVGRVARARRGLEVSGTARLGPLGRRYVNEFYSGSGRIDHVYGVYLGDGGTMLGNKRFVVEPDDSMTIGETRYAGTPGFYELIFKDEPDERIYTEEDKLRYKSILLATNAYRRDHSGETQIMGNKGHKYMRVIRPLISDEKRKKKGAGVPTNMRLTKNVIDYVHWDDPNELVDRLRLLDASRQAGNDSHDNEILSIIEELREAGFIIN